MILEQLAHREQLDCLGHPDCLVTLGQVAMQAPPEHLEPKDRQDQEEILVQEVIVEVRVHQVYEEIRDSQVQQAHQDKEVLLDLQVLLVHLVFPVQVGHQDHLDLLAHQVLLDHEEM